MWHMGEDHYWGMHWFWWTLWIIVAIFVFAAFWYFSRNRTRRETPLDVLKRRYAAGEIDTKEYNIRKKELEKGD